MTKPKYHPAKYNDALFPLFWEICQRFQPRSILDPMAGVGKIAKLRDFGYSGRIVANELEPEWSEQTPPGVEVRTGDARNMFWAQDGEFDMIITSPTYGNRMSDKHNARDRSRRYTYKHSLGRDLTEGNTGGMQWGKEYRETHKEIWAECIRVLAPGGVFVLNVKNHIRKGKVVEVSEWHAQTLQDMGLVLVGRDKVRTPGMRNGENSALRVESEDVWTFVKGANIA